MLKSLNPNPLQRSNGEIQASYKCAHGETRIEDLFQSGCLKLMMPSRREGYVDAIAINTAGGLTGGDQLSYAVNVGAHSRVRIASQTAERLYRSHMGCAKSDLHFHIDRDASLHWLPQETILFNQSRFARNLNVYMSASSHFCIVELMVFGRKAMGEEIKDIFFHDRWRIFRENRLCFADDLRIDHGLSIRNFASLDTYSSCASLLYVAPNAEDYAQSIHALLRHKNVKAGVSGWNSMIYARFLSHDIGDLRQVVMDVYHQLTHHSPPTVWKL